MEAVITKQILFTTNEYAETPSHVRLRFTPYDYTRIAKVMALVENNKLFSARMEFDKVELLNEINEDENEFEKSNFRAWPLTLICYKDTFYFATENKWDSSIQFESDGFTLDEINEKFAKQIKERKK